jgi:NADH:ubiquinone oxidoreductase subunit F (NADH-binding)
VSATSTPSVNAPAPAPTPASALPRLLAGAPGRGALALADHLAIHGDPPGGRARRELAGLIAEVERAGLTGRGGGAFPTAAKMRAVAAAAREPRPTRRLGAGMLSSPSRVPVIVVNAVEAEPASLKDRTLLEAVPHLVLDGGSLAAQALGGRDVIVAVGETARGAHASVARAIRERRRALDGGVGMHIAQIEARYVAGHESALASFLSGREAKPAFTPPRPFERGVDGRPTLVCNAETLAHLALIARHGADWFRALGTPQRPGSVLVTLLGPIPHPGVYEIEHGDSLQSLIGAAGGTTEPVAAALVGGYAGTWIGPSELPRVELDDERLATCGARLGAGIIALVGRNACPLGETVRLARWLAAESAHQCGPCQHGLPALAAALEEAVHRGGQTAAHRIAQLASLVTGRGACAHPDATARLVWSAVNTFPEELQEHARFGPCEACLRPGTLPLPAQRAGPVAQPAPGGAVRVRRPSERGARAGERTRPRQASRPAATRPPGPRAQTPPATAAAGARSSRRRP